MNVPPYPAPATPNPPPTSILITDVLSACLTLPSPPKKSESIDMRFNWIRNRVRQNLFRVNFVSGSLNRADFMAKAPPVHTHIILHSSPISYLAPRGGLLPYSGSSFFIYFFLYLPIFFSWFALRTDLLCFLCPIGNGCVDILFARYQHACIASNLAQTQALLPLGRPLYTTVLHISQATVTCPAASRPPSLYTTSY
jgi:hypothetical protein